MTDLQTRYQIFISSTYEDLRDEREAVSWAIMKLTHIPAGMEAFTAKNDRGWKTIQHAIDDSDYYVLILAGRYGSIEKRWGKSWTHYEYEYAALRGMPILVFIRDPSHINVDKSETNPVQQRLLKAFIRQLKNRHLLQSWKTKADLATEVTTALNAQINEDRGTGKGRLGWHRGDALSKGPLSEIPGGRRQQLEIWRERQQWWAYIPSIIKDSSKLVVVESYFSNHHLFWDALEERLKDKEQFEFVLLLLKEGSPALKNCQKIAHGSAWVAKIDKGRIQGLEKVLAKSPYRKKKTLEFLTWDGHGPGSVIWWIADGTESIGLGCWLQCPGNTDRTPWIVFRQGLLFDSLKAHCENTIGLARSSATSQSRLGTPT